jgi:uncharacterized protein YbbK (DUF523 family)
VTEGSSARPAILVSACLRGARATVELADAVSVTEAVLKARSPSCGEEGVTAVALRTAGVRVRSEEDV